MLKWTLLGASLVVTAGLFLALKYGVAPRPIPLIKPSEVSSLEEAGVLVYRRMRQNIRESQVILAGSLPIFADYPEFWQGFVLAAREDKAGIEKIFTTTDLNLFKESQLFSKTFMSLEEMQNMVGSSMALTRRTLFYVPSTESSHVNGQSLSKLFDKKRVNKVSITLHKFHTNKNNHSFEKLNCENKKNSFLHRLDCLGRGVTIYGSRKKLNAKKSYVALYRYGLSDYVAFWHMAEK